MSDSPELAIESRPTLGTRLRWKTDSVKRYFWDVLVGAALSIIRKASSDSNIKRHAEREFKTIGYTPLNEKQEDDPNKWIQENIMDLLSVFSLQGHSGSSAPYCIRFFKDLADFKPLSPIKCDESEWNETSESGTYQNNRLSSVFKEGKDGKPYYINAIIWKTQKGHTYGGSALITDGRSISSRQYIRLPFVPKTFYIDVLEYEIGEDDWEFRVHDEFKLDEVFKYYDRMTK